MIFEHRGTQQLIANIDRRAHRCWRVGSTVFAPRCQGSRSSVDPQASTIPPNFTNGSSSALLQPGYQRGYGY